MVISQSNGTGVTDAALHIGFRGPGTAGDNMTFAFFGDDTNVSDAMTNTAIQKNACTDLQWHHWAFVYQKGTSNGVQKVYCDGTLVSTRTTTGLYSGGALPIYLGTNYARSTTLNAFVQELRIWNGALAAATIAGKYQNTLRGTDTGTTVGNTPAALLALWPMSNVTNAYGTTLKDLCNDQHPATLTAARPVQMWPSALAPTPAVGALYFNGTGASSQFNLTLSSSFTIEFWCKRAALGHRDYVFQQNATPGQTGGMDNVLSIGFTAGNQVLFGFRNDDVTLFHPACVDLQWHHWAFTYDGTTRIRSIYLDGANLINTPVPGGAYSPTSNATILGADQVLSVILTAYVQELRVWNSALSPAAIAGNMNVALSGSQTGLLALWPMNNVSGTSLVDRTGRNSVTIGSYGAAFAASQLNATSLAPVAPLQPAPVLSSAPVGADAPEIANPFNGNDADCAGHVSNPLGINLPISAEEYGVVEADADGDAVGVLKRGYSLIKNGAWLLAGGCKVADLLLEWIGQVQFNPQLMGYIEGAPPVPGENLINPDMDYRGASSVELTCADSVAYSYDATRNKGFDYSLDMAATAGFADNSSFIATVLGVGTAKQIDDADVEIGVHSTIEGGTGKSSGAAASVSMSQSQLSQVSLMGYPVSVDPGDGLGVRWVPLNVGNAIVKSSTADLYAMRLVSNNALVGYQMVPNPHIPPDWNLITFPLNPYYTRQGCLDGHFGGKTDPFFPVVASAPTADASYRRVTEAYALKSRIDREAQRLYAQYLGNDAVAQGCASWVDADRINASMARYIPGADNRPALSLGSTPSTNGSGSVQRSNSDPTQLVKRNLCNTYVWTAYGGLFAETEESLDGFTETYGGEYHFKGMAGLQVKDSLKFVNAALTFSLDALFGGHVDVTMTKSAEATTGFGLSVSLGVGPDLSSAGSGLSANVFQQVTDDYCSVGSKKLKTNTPASGMVDAYRFMTFYLAPTANNFTEFFNRVVNQDWLASNDPNAVALRSARASGQSPPCWRVMHRVTFVSRIATTKSAPPLASPTITLNAASHYLLIKQLEPYVRGSTGSWGALLSAVTNTLKTNFASDFPSVTSPTDPTALQIAKVLASYYGVSVPQ